MNVHISIIGAAGKIGRMLVPSLLHAYSADLERISLISPLGESVSEKLSALERQCAAFGSLVDVRACTFDEAKESDITLFLADHSFNRVYAQTRISAQKPVSRFDTGRNNIPLIEEYSEAFKGYKGHILMVTNHVDLLCTLLASQSGISPHYISGLSWNDTLRLYGCLPDIFSFKGSPSGVVMIGTHDEYAVASFRPDARIGSFLLRDHSGFAEIVQNDILERMVKARAISELGFLQDTSNVTVHAIEEHLRFLLGKEHSPDFVYSHPCSFFESDDPIYAGTDVQDAYVRLLLPHKRKQFRLGLERIAREVTKNKKRIKKVDADGFFDFEFDFSNKEGVIHSFDSLDIFYMRDTDVYYTQVSEIASSYWDNEDLLSLLTDDLEESSAHFVRILIEYKRIMNSFSHFSKQIERYDEIETGINRFDPFVQTQASFSSLEEVHAFFAATTHAKDFCKYVDPAVYAREAHCEMLARSRLRDAKDEFRASLFAELSTIRESVSNLEEHFDAHIERTAHYNVFTQALRADIRFMLGDVDGAQDYARESYAEYPMRFAVHILNDIARLQEGNYSGAYEDNDALFPTDAQKYSLDFLRDGFAMCIYANFLAGRMGPQ